MTDASREPGYRGSLPPKNDRLAKPWVLIALLITVLIFGLAFLDVPTRFLPEPTVVPTPSVSPVPSGSGEPSASEVASPSPSPSPSPTATP